MQELIVNIAINVKSSAFFMIYLLLITDANMRPYFVFFYGRKYASLLCPFLMDAIMRPYFVLNTNFCLLPSCLLPYISPHSGLFSGMSASTSYKISRSMSCNSPTLSGYFSDKSFCSSRSVLRLYNSTF